MDVFRTNPELFIEKSEILKALAHPQRLCIVKMLCEKESASVSDMQTCLDEAQPTVSQHLSKLKLARLIEGKRDGNSIYYSISDEETLKRIKSIIENLFEDQSFVYLVKKMEAYDEKN